MSWITCHHVVLCDFVSFCDSLFWLLEKSTFECSCSEVWPWTRRSISEEERRWIQSLELLELAQAMSMYLHLSCISSGGPFGLEHATAEFHQRSEPPSALEYL